MDAGADNVEVRNSFVYDYGLDGVHVAGLNATIANCTFALNAATQGTRTGNGSTPCHPRPIVARRRRRAKPDRDDSAQVTGGGPNPVR